MKTPLLLLLTALAGGILYAQAGMHVIGTATYEGPQAMVQAVAAAQSRATIPFVPDCGMVNGVLVSKPCKQYAEELAKRLEVYEPKDYRRIAHPSQGDCFYVWMPNADHNGGATPGNFSRHGLMVWLNRAVPAMDFHQNSLEVKACDGIKP